MSQLGETDAFYHVLTKADDSVIMAMMNDQSSQPGIRSILLQDKFWYERCMYLVHRNLTWREDVKWQEVYSVLRRVNEVGIDESYDRARNSLPLLLVLEEALGEIENPWWIIANTKNLQVLDYLVKKYGEEYSTDDIFVDISNRFVSGTVTEEIIDYLINLIPKNTPRRRMPGILRNAISRNYISEYERLSKYSDAIPNRTDILKAISDTDNVDALKYVIDNFNPTRDELIDYSLGTSAARGSTDVMEYLITYLVPNEEEMKNLLDSTVVAGSIKGLNVLEKYMVTDWLNALGITAVYRYGGQSRDSILIRYILDHIPPNANLYNYLVLSISSAYFLDLLNDPRSHAAENIDQLMNIALTRANPRSTVEIILGNPVTRIEDLNHKTIEKLLILFKMIPDPKGSPSELADCPASALIVLQILAKRQSKLDLLDWIIDSHIPEAAEAADYVMDTSLRPVRDMSLDVAAIRALLISLLYPGMPRQQARYYLKKECSPAQMKIADIMLHSYSLLKE